MFHLRQLVFPFAGQLGLGQFFHAQAAQQRHQLEGLGRGHQFAAVAQHVLLGDQAFDDGRTRGRCAQALFLHRLAQLVVLDQLARAFHGAQQRGLGVARRRAGFQSLGLNLRGQRLLARLHRHQVLALVAVLGIGHFVGGFLAVDGEPARLDQHLALGLEMVCSRACQRVCCAAPRGGRALLGAALRCGIHADRADAGCHHVLGAGEEHRHEAAHHQVVQLLLGVGEALRRLQRRDDGKVVADLAVVKHALAGPHIAFLEGRLGKRLQVAHAAVGQHRKGLLHGRQIVFRQRA